ncbi:MAG: DUF4388 domain-containing protein, partial [Holophagales bacterium]|nr:DUF4388 domain-containing protein [Holophagales bacterium]
MSLNGKLEDVSLADVMQFVHLGRRTGTLSLSRGSDEAEIGFHRGQIVSALATGTLRLADLLVERGLVPRETMSELLRQQSSEQPRRSLGQILVTSGTLDFEQIKTVLQVQIEEAIYELVTWTSGSFEFALDELKAIEDIAMYPGDVIPKLDLNTQMVLLEATRIMDEAKQKEKEGGDPAEVWRQRQRPTEAGAESPAGEPRESAASEPSAGRLAEERSLASVSEVIEGLDLDLPLEPETDAFLPEAASRRLQVVSPDRRLFEDLGQIIQPEIAQVVRLPLREAG